MSDEMQSITQIATLSGMNVDDEVSASNMLHTRRVLERFVWFRIEPVVAFWLVILLVAGIRWHLRQMPLERDEGEYAYAGQLILQGVPPYQIAYNMKLPGTYVAYAVILRTFGETAASIHVGLIIVNTLTTLLVYMIGKRLYGEAGSVVAGISYALLSIGPWVNGVAAHATHFVVLAALAGLLMLMKAIEKESNWMLFGAGLLLGLAFLMKQQGAVFGLFGAFYALKKAGREPGKIRAAVRVGCLGSGGIVPYAITCLVLWQAGVFRKFWFWTISYAYQYGTSLKAADGWKSFVENFSRIVLSGTGLWVLAAAGITAFLWSARGRAHADFLLGLLFFSSIGVSPGLYFRGHYFILLLPAVSLMVGLAVSSAAPQADEMPTAMQGILLAVFVAACVVLLLQQEYFFFRADPISASRYVYPRDPFPEVAQIGRYIEQHSSPADSIAVLGSEPQIMFYARRRSATGYLYAYPLTESQKYARTMQQEVISEIEVARPRFLVFIDDWVIQPGSEKSIFVWLRKYVTENYELVGAMRVSDGLQFRSKAEILQEPRDPAGASFLFRRMDPPIGAVKGR